MLNVNNDSVGVRVFVNDSVLKRKNKHYKTLAGKTGTICSVWEDNVGVKLDNTTNDLSQFGYFYFKPNELETLDNKQVIERTDNMNTENHNNYNNFCLPKLLVVRDLYIITIFIKRLNYINPQRKV